LIRRQLIKFCKTMRLSLFSPQSTSVFYTLSLHDALPISVHLTHSADRSGIGRLAPGNKRSITNCVFKHHIACRRSYVSEKRPIRSEEHTSELQSRFDLVCRLLLEKKNRTPINRTCLPPDN